MTSFVLIVALLGCAVMLCLLPPLLRRAGPATARRAHDQANLQILRDQVRELDADLASGVISASGHAAARAELAGRVLEDVTPAAAAAPSPPQPRMALALAAGIALFAALLYLQVGNPAAVTVRPAPVQHDEAGSVGASVDAMARRLRDRDDDIEGLHMLARSYSALERHAEAARTYARLAALLPREAGVLADYADALATAQGASLKGEPERLIERALALDPAQVKALSLAGSAAYQRGDFGQAQARWQAVLGLVPADSAFAEQTRKAIAAADARITGHTPAASVASAGSAPAPAAHGLSGVVRLAPALAAAAAPDDTVFIFARAPEAKGPPLAALRRKVRDLPLQFTLDDSMGTGATAPLSSQQRVVVGARIARSGSATPAAGDLEAISAPVASDASGVVIEIATRRP